MSDSDSTVPEAPTVLLVEHGGYFSGEGWAARCLRSHLLDLEGGSTSESFSSDDIATCLRQWIQFGEDTFGEDRLRGFVDRIEQASKDCLLHALIIKRAHDEMSGPKKTDPADIGRAFEEEVEEWEL